MRDEQILRHIKTHSERSAEDRAAVGTLDFFLKSHGRINTNFASNDKWPNSDGTFEFVPNPDISRRPEQSFVVQIKGTHYYTEKDGGINYSLKSLAFPATICANVTFDPGILFVVLNPDERGEERVFWKYMSVDFVNSINYVQDSWTVHFTPEEEIENTEESIDRFCKRLEEIVEHHSFVARLDKTEYSRKEIEGLITYCDAQITECIDRVEIYNDTRDDVSRRLLRLMKDFCVAVLLLNTLTADGETINMQLAWERSLLNIRTKYLGTFYQGLEYVGYRLPEEGQSERLMLKYYDFLWMIRNTLQSDFGISVLPNLEKFPVCVNELDQEYYRLAADAVESVEKRDRLVGVSRFYVQKKTSFYIGKERYYELTLQLAGVYATKFNRITAYTKENISSNYSVQISYTDVAINLWGIDSKIKVITDWKVSIDPVCMNKLGKILGFKTRLTSKYREYISLMNFLTKTGISLLQLIDLQEIEFESVINSVYENANTVVFKEILQLLREEYSASSQKTGRNVIRYLLLNLREEMLENVMATSYDKKWLSDDLRITNQCYPFEKNPFISNLPHSRSTTTKTIKYLTSVAGEKKLKTAYPYIKLRAKTMQTGEIYFEEGIVSDKEIRKFNRSVDNWEQRQGNVLKKENGLVYIDFYEKTTINILKKLLEFSKRENRGQREVNLDFIRKNSVVSSDMLKVQAIKGAFVHSGVLLIYGSAGTGKTTLINYLSNMMGGKKKLFLSKTHTSLKNLRRRIDDLGENTTFATVDSFRNKSIRGKYDIIFIDECSTIDNRIMEILLNKISPDTFLVLAGDIHQIEAIDFGNWFFYAKEIITTRGANVELTNTWRTKDKFLISLWNEVREKKPMITEKLVIDGPFSKEIGPDLFEREEEDEVVLCLNYDGKFGLNNMNNYFQNANKKSEAVVWYEWSYKEGDPILFNESKRFPLLYNNLKGRITAIEKTRSKITFTIDIDLLLTERDCQRNEIEYVGSDGETTRIRFSVYRYRNDSNIPEAEMEEMRMKSVVPFQLAYAVSIHKAQGLEYDSVKIVIPDSNSEKITHGIFYTAITRAKKKLKIYWSSETMQEIISKFSAEELKNKSLEIIKGKCF